MHSLELVFPVARRDTFFMTALKEHPVLICLIRPNRLYLFRKTLPPDTPPMNARSLCPHCQKGYHWARDYRSRFHRYGAFLGPNQQSGNGLRGQPQAPTMIGTDSLNPFIPFVPSQSSSKQPQAAQDWTSVPPPQQY